MAGGATGTGGGEDSPGACARPSGDESSVDLPLFSTTFPDSLLSRNHLNENLASSPECQGTYVKQYRIFSIVQDDWAHAELLG